jgi:hypothetical protein
MAPKLQLFTGGKPDAGPVLLAPPIAAKLAAADCLVVAIKGQLGDARLALEAGTAGASTSVAALSKQLAAARDDAASLRAAHARALELDGQAHAAANTTAQRAQLVVMEARCADRSAAIADLTTAAQTVADAYARFVKSGEAMLASVPTGIASTPGLILASGEMLFQAELFRHLAALGLVMQIARPPSFDLRDNPAAIEAAPAVVARENEFLVSHTRSQIEAGQPAARDLIA